MGIETLLSDDLDCNEPLYTMIESVLFRLEEHYHTGTEWCVDEINRDITKALGKYTINTLLEAVRIGVTYITSDIDRLILKMNIQVDDNDLLHEQVEEISGRKRCDKFVNFLTGNESFHTYKNRRLFSVLGKTVYNNEVFIDAILIIVNSLTNKLEGKCITDAEWYDTICLTEQLPTIKLLTNLNVNYIFEQERNYSSDKVNEKNDEYDNSPLNKIRKKLVIAECLVVLSEYSNDISIVNCKKKIKKSVEKKLTKLYMSGDLDDIQGTDDYFDMPAKALERWIVEAKLVYKNRNSII